MEPDIDDPGPMPEALDLPPESVIDKMIAVVVRQIPEILRPEGVFPRSHLDRWARANGWKKIGADEESE